MAKIPTKQILPDEFPAGLRVLAVDDDPDSFETIKQMCVHCKYQVTPYIDASLALNLLRERKLDVDMILVEVHLKNMDGYYFLQRVNQEINVPVIVMSVDSATRAALKAIELGACDYWIKPLREEQIRDMWLHFARKFLNKNEGHKIFGSLEDDSCKKRGNEGSKFASSSSSVIDATERVVGDQRNCNSRGANHVHETENLYRTPTKKPRVMWSTELHQKFVDAVNRLGFDKAMPRTILEEMKIPYLTRENVASHLQKFRLHLKRSDGVAMQQNMMAQSPANKVLRKIESRQGACERYGLMASTSTSHVPYGTMTDLYANMMPKEEQSALPKQTIQWPNHSLPQQSVPYAQPLARCSPTNNFHQALVTLDDAPNRYGSCSPPNNTLDPMVVLNGFQNLAMHKNNVPLQALLQQQQQQQQKEELVHQQSLMQHHQIHANNGLPSCMLTSNQNCSFGGNSVVNNYGLVSPQPNYSVIVAQFPGENNRICSTASVSMISQPTLTTPFTSAVPIAQDPSVSRSIDSLCEESLKNLGYDGTSGGLENKASEKQNDWSSSDSKEEEREGWDLGEETKELLLSFDLSIYFDDEWYGVYYVTCLVFFLGRLYIMVNATKGVFISCDVPMAQYIINMNASLPASDKFIIHILDNTHMFVQPHVEQMIRSQIAKFREDNTYVKPT
ncbi:hypothetical protein RJT34_04821 [Clitoria ternatea]|uniref:Response regulatory domain-containing protein n=1 Tax=Clitoria ternatea TaxID=43366 RepID=A0AAN9Q0V9_CLITE